MTCRPAGIVALLVALVDPTGAANAQAPDCTYDRCSLRLQVGPFADRIVQGTSATLVSRLGPFAPRIDLLARAGDSTRTHYESFRTSQNRGGALNFVSFAATIVAGSLWDYRSPPQDAVWVLLGVGAGFSIAGTISVRKGRDHLHKAIWFFNRSLRAVP